MVYNIDLRRRLMWCIHRHVSTNISFNRDVIDIVGLHPRVLISAALGAGEFHTIREGLRKKGIDTKVKTVLRNLKFAMREVEGTEGEKDMLWMKFTALRVWRGCSIVFFTLNPHDIWSPLTVVFSNGTAWQGESIRLDWDDVEMRRFYEEAKIGDPLIFHRLVAEDAGAAAEAA